jgi:AraC-like DNA-binding protein
VVVERVLENLTLRLEPFALCEVSSGWRLRLGGPDWVTFHFVLKGDGALRADNGAPMPLRASSLAIVPPRLSHTLEAGTRVSRETTPPPSPPVRDGLAELVAGPDGDRDVVVACGRARVYADGIGLFDLMSSPLVLDFAGSGEMRSIFHRLLREERGRSLGTHAMVAALMSECIVLMFRRLAEGTGPDPPWLSALADPQMAPAIDAMLARPASKHSVESLAERVHMSRSAFAAHFSASMGTAPMTFLRNLRIRRGAELLRTTDLPVDIVAARVGFASRSHFSRAFQQSYGEAPTQFRHSVDPDHSRKEN